MEVVDNMTKDQLVSVIMPVYNAEEYIEQSILSIMNQNYPSIELLIINDGSTDKTGDICSRLVETDERIRYFSQDNAGPSAARNYGLRECAGDYITFIDADDRFEPDAVNEMVKASQDVDYVVAGYSNDLSSSGGYESSAVMPGKYAGEYLKEAFLTHYSELFEADLIHYIWHKLYRKEYAKDLRFDESMKIGEDLLFNLEYLNQIRRVRVIDQIVTRHIKDNAQSLTKTFQPGLLDYRIRIYNKSKQFLMDNNSWTDKNKEALNRYFSRKLYTAVKNYYMPSSPLTYSEKVILSRRVIDEPVVRKLNSWFGEFSFSAKCMSRLISRNRPRSLTLFATVYFKLMS